MLRRGKENAMGSPRNDQLFSLLIAIWGGVFTWSIIGFASGDATGDGFTHGLNRITGFLLWQFAAAGLSIPVFLVGRGYDRGSALRWISRVPLVLALTLGLAIAATFAWARYAAG
jgi:hypothetical protein